MAICTDSTEGTIIMSRQNHQKGAHDSIILTAICNDNTKGTSGGYKGAQQQLLCASKHLAQQSAYTDTHTHTQPRCRHKYMPEGTGNTISLHTQTYARTHAAMCADTSACQKAQGTLYHPSLRFTFVLCRSKHQAQ
eukprot:scaffold259714_cov24-Tisochrysis_lutea.AAC.1